MENLKVSISLTLEQGSLGVMTIHLPHPQCPTKGVRPPVPPAPCPLPLLPLLICVMRKFNLPKRSKRSVLLGLPPYPTPRATTAPGPTLHFPSRVAALPPLLRLPLASCTAKVAYPQRILCAPQLCKRVWRVERGREREGGCRKPTLIACILQAAWQLLQLRGKCRMPHAACFALALVLINF